MDPHFIVELNISVAHIQHNVAMVITYVLGNKRV